MFRTLKDKKGATVILMALLLIVLCGAAALCIDVGQLYIARERAQNAVDAAALAGISAWPLDDQMTSRATDYAYNNEAGLQDLQITFSDVNSGDHKKLTVQGALPVEFTFAKVLGFDNRLVYAKATASINLLGEYRGDLVPFGISKSTVDNLKEGVTQILKFSNWDDFVDAPGNFGLVALDGTGGDKVRRSIANGTTGIYEINQWVQTEPGNEVGPIKQGLDDRISKSNSKLDTFGEWTLAGRPDNYRLITIPVITLPDAGRDYVQIVGFAEFYLVGPCNSGKEVTGAFVKRVDTMGGGGTLPTETYYAHLIE